MSIKEDLYDIVNNTPESSSDIRKDLQEIVQSTPFQEEQSVQTGSFGQRRFKINSEQDTAKSEQSKSTLEKITGSPFTTLIGTIGELSRREEGVFANIAADYLKQGDLTAGQAIKGATEAITGKRVTEFGDVLKQLGADDASAAIGGLAMSAFLPSNFLLAGAGKGGTLSTKNAQKLAKVYYRSPNKTKNPFVGLAANFLGKDSRRVKQLLNNPEIYSPRNADARNASIIAGKIQKGLKYLKETAPDVLEPSPEIPFNIAKKAIGTFDDIFKNTRIAHNQLKNKIVKQNPDSIIGKDELINQLKSSAEEAQKAVVRGSDVPRAEAAKAQKFFNSFMDNLKNRTETGKLGEFGTVSTKQKGFGLQDLFDIREDLGKTAAGSFQVEGAAPVINRTIDSLTKNLRKKVSNIIQDRFPEIAASDAQFVALGDVDNALKLRAIRKSGQLGNTLKAKQINPFKAEGIQLLDEILPEQSKISPALQAFAEARDTSLASNLKGIGIKFGDKLGSEKMALNFDAIDTPTSQTQLLRKLDAALPENMRFFDDLAKFDLARAFSKAGSIFKASASGNLAAGAVPEAKPLGLLAGVAGTIPPVFARSVQGTTALSQALKSVAGSQPSRQAQIALLRQLAEQQQG